MKRKNFKQVLHVLVPFILLISCLSVVIFIAVQQTIRLSGNNPQIQMAEDATSTLEQGVAPSTLLTGQSVDIAKSLSPFLIIYDSNGKLIGSTGRLHGVLPLLPSSVFPDVAKRGQERFTWEPDPGVRIAAVVTKVNDKQAGFVLAGRNMREIEKLEDIVQKDVFLGWFATLVVTTLVIVLL